MRWTNSDLINCPAPRPAGGQRPVGDVLPAGRWPPPGITARFRRSERAKLSVHRMHDSDLDQSRGAPSTEQQACWPASPTCARIHTTRTKSKGPGPLAGLDLTKRFRARLFARINHSIAINYKASRAFMGRGWAKLCLHLASRFCSVAFMPPPLRRDSSSTGKRR
jgi:hypothetical protein